MRKIPFIIFVIIEIAMTIKRLLNNRKQKKILKNLLLEIKSNPEIINNLVNELYELCYSLSLEKDILFKNFVDKYKIGDVLGSSKIEHIEKINQNEFVFITICQNEGYDIDINGEFGDVEKVFNINYLLKYNPYTMKILMYSEFTRDGYQKGLRLSFANNFFKI